MSLIVVPFSDEQVEALNEYQASGVFHEYTCPKPCKKRVLIATKDGWICQCGDYSQLWAHEGSLTVYKNLPDYLTTKTTNI